MPELRYPAELPITERRAELVAAIRDHQVVVVAGETGSGKSTQLPKLCLEAGRGQAGLVGHTQPRRIAARAVAERVAEELGTTVGGAVGFAVRFTDRTGPETLVKVMTDGILLAEVQRDRDLSAYDTLIIDEAHERSLNIDFLLGYLTQLLARRPDLKLVVTSATIDTARFAAHFADHGIEAPVIEVSGRTYPVELRYRPVGEPGDDRDQVAAIGDAVRELAAEGPGDVLVFLSGERDIRDTADALGRLGLPDTDVLPLYARLSAAEQHRVFAPHQGRRIVLATNVAETSLTVPGIRYVVDPGTARISRYNRRTKVQRLPIEAVSQASANQRAGRCGRVAPGICIRLFSEEDFDARPEFTEPEVLRTNLASVVLQMAAIGLGDIERFPFVEPPDARSIADGILLLEELGAIRQPDGERAGARDGAVRLTGIGRRLARLPVDPRLGRMVLEADRLGCVREVLVIAAAMSIIDPRERPQGPESSRAAELHRRFDDPSSDFLAFLNLWSYLRELRHELSSSQFRKRVRSEHLNWLRVREWEDVHSQLRQIAGGLGIHATGGRGDGAEPASPDSVHQALLAGLLSHIGNWDEERADYLGARQARFVIGRGSSLSRAKARPRWVVAGELVETNRLWAHSAARIRPEWIERAAGDVAKRTRGEPWWDDQRGAALVEERVSVFGLEVARRRVALARFDEPLARELFIFHALVLGEWAGDAADEVRDLNAAAIASIEAWEAKARRRDLLVDHDAMWDLYDARLPASVTSGAAFARWWRDHRLADPDILRFGTDELVDPDAGEVSAHAYPDSWPAGDVELALEYRFEPGDVLDGVVADVPVDVLNRIEPAGLDWQVPGNRGELVTALVRSLPKARRRAFVPVPDHVAAFLAEHGPADGPLVEVLAHALTRAAGERVSPDELDLAGVPDHLRVTYRAVGPGGRAVSWSKDLDALRAHLAPKVRDTIQEVVARSAPELQHSGLTSWSIDPLPRQLTSEVDGRTVTAHPALVDEGETVGVRAFASADEAAASHRSGLRRLLLLGIGDLGKRTRKGLPRDAELSLAGLGIPLGALFDDVAAAVVDASISSPSKVRDAEAFDALLLAVREDGVGRGLDAAAVLARIGDHVRGLELRLAGDDGPAAADVRVQVVGLVHPGFVSEAGLDRLRDVERYLAAADVRLDKLGGDPGRDRRHQFLVQGLEDEWAAVADGDAGGKVRWMIEELRVSLFAQSLGTRGSISEQRVRKALATLRAAG